MRNLKTSVKVQQGSQSSLDEVRSRLGVPNMQTNDLENGQESGWAIPSSRSDCRRLQSSYSSISAQGLYYLLPAVQVTERQLSRGIQNQTTRVPGPDPNLCQLHNLTFARLPFIICNNAHHTGWS